MVQNMCISNDHKKVKLIYLKFFEIAKQKYDIYIFYKVYDYFSFKSIAESIFLIMKKYFHFHKLTFFFKS